MVYLKKQSLAVIAVILACGSAFADMRMWRPISGDSFMAEYVREQFGNFYFRDANKDMQKVAVTNLIETDVAYIRTLIPPEMEVQVKRKKKAKERNPEGYNAAPDDKYDIVTLTATIKKVTKDPFHGKLTGELYVVGKELVTSDLKMMDIRKFPVEFSKDKAKSCVFSASVEFRTYEEWNTIERRGQDYEGYALVILGSDGAVLEKATSLSWLEEEKWDALRALPMLSWFDDDCKRRTPPRMKVDNIPRLDN